MPAPGKPSETGHDPGMPAYARPAFAGHGCAGQDARAPAEALRPVATAGACPRHVLLAPGKPSETVHGLAIPTYARPAFARLRRDGHADSPLARGGLPVHKAGHRRG